ncbi:MAG: leucine-rich repeat protein [Clostridia bacterium]|nr:leucine-rich repeat protein [Clostridia bacterium]
MKKSKRILAALLCAVMVLAFVPAFSVSAATYSGTCGDNLTWNLSTSSGVLTISGTGDMEDYNTCDTAPWYSYRTSITSVAISNGVTSIGIWVFYRCTSLASVNIPGSVTSIGALAFYSCGSLASVSLGSGITTIGSSAFQNCGSLESIAIPDGVTSISFNLFQNCSSLTSVVIPDSVTGIETFAFRYCSSLENVTIPENVTYISRCAFYGCSALQSVSIPASVTSIGEEAFGDCRSLTKVIYAGSEADWNNIDIQDGNDSLKTAYENSNFAEIEWDITDGVLTISGTGRMPDYEDADENRAPWYEYNESITSVVVNEGLTSIGAYAFEDLINAQTVSIPDSVTQIGTKAFEECFALTEISISSYVTSIGDCAFLTCSSLTSISVDENNEYYCSVDGILYSKDMTQLICCPMANPTTSLDIPDTVTNLWNSALQGCTNLVSVSIPESLSCIGFSAFSGCSCLRSISIPASVTDIIWNAFGDCFSLLNVYYGGTEEQWNAINIEENNDSLKNAYAYTTGYALNGATDLAWSLSDGTLTISGNGWMPNYGASWGAEPTDEYRPEWYAERDEITSIVIEDGITRIGNFAFHYLSNVTSVTIADSVTEIGYQSFQFCSSLESVTLSANAMLIEAYAFDGCEILSSVSYDGCEDDWNSISIEDGNDYLRGAYENSLYFADVEWDIDENGVLTLSGTGKMPDYDDNDESRAPWYEYKDSITAVVIEEGLTSVGNHAFNTFNQITSVSLPEGIESIGSWSFCGCTNLQSITFPESLKTISCNAFEGCESITAIHIPQNVTYIDFFAFGGCNNIASLTADENNACYYAENNALYFNDKTELVYYAPACDAESLEILDSVTGIWGSALRRCTNLVSVTLPDGVDNIGSYAFDGCNNLAQITIPGGLTFIGEYAFGDCWSLSSVSYSGSEDDWNSITIEDGNECLQTAYENSKTTVYSGACGDNLTWQLDVASGTLTVDGTGDMASSEGWQDYKSLITSIVINDGVTKIASDAFSECENLASVTISDSVTAIESGAFAGCTDLTDVYYTGGEDAWSEISIDADNDPLTSSMIHYYYGYTTASVTIKYCDTDGNFISDDVTRTAKTDETYTVPDSLKSLDSGNDGTFTYSYSLIASESCDSLYVTENGENVCTLVYDVTKILTGTVNLITNGDFATGDTTGWTNRSGSDITDYEIIYDDTIGCNVLSMSAGGKWATNNIGTHWSVTPGKTYTFSSYNKFIDLISRL